MADSRLRVDGLDENITAKELRLAFEEFGEVREVSIHQGGDLHYALITMPLKDAERACRYGNSKNYAPRIRKCWLRVSFANRSRGSWLSHDWHPPDHKRWY